MGAALIDRSARPMGLTPAGTMFRRHAQTILNVEAEARSELAMADLSGLTTLRLGVIDDFFWKPGPATGCWTSWKPVRWTWSSPPIWEAKGPMTAGARCIP